MQVNKLRLAGFKSFVDATELLIEPGLTGVIGPNGCGKSNLVEALRWVMGETSSKSLRGDGMEDTIFGGTANRPARQVAEVVLALQNTERDAPAVYNDREEIEVCRRIERGAGSSYRINGHEVRARDVQLLFADLATGAHSTALVSQGRIGALIGAKPIQRRGLLEEAAGITGLHARRHDTELRLRGAETNLGRLEDVLEALDGQLQSLKKQAAQARRYRRLNELVRRQEAILLHIHWRQAETTIAAAAARHDEAQAAVNARTRSAAAAAAEQADKAAAIPPLRQAEAEAAAELQRFLVAGNELDAEAARLARAREENRRRRDQIGGDIERERTLAADAETAVERLEDERGPLAAARQGEAEAEAEAGAEAAAAEAALGEIEGRLTGLTERLAASVARRDDLGHRVDELQARGDRLARRAAEVADQRLEAAEADSPDIGTAEAEAAERRLDDARAAAEAAEAQLSTARAAEEQAREAARRSEAEWAAAAAEESALAKLMAADHRGAWPPIVDAVSVDAGFEAALGAALGDDLTAPAETDAPVHWTELAPLPQPPALPAEAEPLAAHVRAPAALSRRLTQVGVVADRARGGALQGRLAPGQRLVTRDGAMWRWDGFTVAAGPEAGAAARLEQRNRSVELRRRLAGMDKRRAAAAAQAETARAASAETVQAETAARKALRDAYAERDRMRQAQAARLQEAAAARSRRAALDEAAARADADHAEARDGLQAARAALAELPDLAGARREIDGLRTEVARRRARLVEARSAHDVMVRTAADRDRRLGDIEDEVGSWRDRAVGARTQLAALEERLRAALAEDQALAARPAEIVDQRRQVHAKTEAAEARRGQVADRLAVAETGLADCDRRLKRAEAELAQAREERVRLEAAVAQAEQARQTVAERIAERLDCAPESAREAAGLSADDPLPDAPPVEAKLERLTRERERVGAVNLRAEEEADSLAEQLTTMASERDDLIAAIARLRQGIAVLNREGRERLLASFEKVNKHFSELFIELFGGGRAHLELGGDDDPLEAGLEIMASPPGKRLQTLSLLSGGEQALTALALMFAVFLTNPAPICVLDEVDATLDDANVDRFCTMLESIARATRTRFLVITHHRMTMARMDRLFGVTMAERGISRLVSVDLRQAERLKATA